MKLLSTMASAEALPTVMLLGSMKKYTAEAIMPVARVMMIKSFMELCEYILLDDENCTVVNVYRMYSDLEEIQKDAAYKILPLNGDYDSVMSLMEHTAFDDGPGVESWSVYGFQRESDGRWMAPPLEELEYDLPW